MLTEFIGVLFVGLTVVVVVVRCCRCLLASDCAMLSMLVEFEGPRPRPGDFGAVFPPPGDTVLPDGVWVAPLPEDGTTRL